MTKTPNQPAQIEADGYDRLINSQIAQSSNFLQTVSELMGRPLVMACSLSTEPDTVVHGDSDNVNNDVTGLTIALKCSPELAQEICTKLDLILREHKLRSQPPNRQN